MTEHTWQFQAECEDNSHPFIEVSEEPYLADEEWESVERTYIYVNGKPAEVTFYPERRALQMSAGDDPSEEDGFRRALLGLILIKLMQAGKQPVEEL